MATSPPSDADQRYSYEARPDQPSSPLAREIHVVRLIHFPRRCVVGVVLPLSMSLRIVTAPPLISAAFCCVESAEAAAEPAAAKGNYHIPRGDAATMLRQFATISGSPVLFMMDKVQGEQTNSVDGEYTPSEALKIMLAGTSLEIMQETEIKGFVVGRKASSLQREMPSLSTPSTVIAW